MGSTKTVKEAAEIISGLLSVIHVDADKWGEHEHEIIREARSFLGDLDTQEVPPTKRPRFPE